MSSDTEVVRDFTYPVFDDRPLSWHRLSALKRLRSEPGEAQVLFRHGRPVLVLMPDGRRSSLRVRMSRFTRVASVDVLPHDLTLDGRLPCTGGAHYFGVILRLTCRVRDPEQILAGNIKNANERLKRTLFERIHQIDHQHGVDDVIRVRKAILDRFPPSELAQIEPAFELTKLSVEVQIDESLQSLLQAQMERQYFETVVREGPMAIAAHYLSRNQSNPETALKILQDHRRELVRLRREEEEYLIDHHVVRAEQLEDRALKRLDELELPVKEPRMLAMPPPPDDLEASSTPKASNGSGD